MTERKINQTHIALIGAYALALVAVALFVPLRIPEIQAIAWRADFSWTNLWSWICAAPDPSPLGYLVQLPFVMLLGTSRLIPRLPALLFAVASCIPFLQLAQRAVPKRTSTALLLFMLLPLQMLTITSTTQYQMAMFFVLLSLVAFFHLIARPSYISSVLFSLAIVACLYTDHHAGLPAVGAVLFLLRFAPFPQQRKATYFALGSSVVAGAVYAPYYFWVHGQASPYWYLESSLSGSSLDSATPIDWALAASVLLILFGVCIAAIVSFRIPVAAITRRMGLFCLFGSVLVPLALVLGISLLTLTPLSARDLIYEAPASLILFFASLDWLAGLRSLIVPATLIRFAAIAVAVVVFACFALADAQLLTSPKEDLALESSYVAPELEGDSCVVFVSERYSKALFTLFEPQLAKHECTTFFHRRIVLAMHPAVRPDQQADAEGFFRGLNFHEVKRIRSGGGEIVVMESN